jgi:hypothetical protein
MNLAKSLKYFVVVLLSLCMTFFVAQSIRATVPDSKLPSLDSLYKPRAIPIASIPDISDIVAADNSISNVPPNRRMNIPLPSSNPREYLVAEGTVNPRTGGEEPIEAGKVRKMYQREVALRQLGSGNGFNSDDRSGSTLLASMDLNNLAQYRSCAFVDAYGTVYDKCKIDLVVRDLRSGKVEIIKAYIDRFCVYAMIASINRTWF